MVGGPTDPAAAARDPEAAPRCRARCKPPWPPAILPSLELAPVFGVCSGSATDPRTAMDLHAKLSILADAAKYDASCASSGAGGRRASPRGLGSTEGMGICHS